MKVAIKKILKYLKLRDIKPKPPLRKGSAVWVIGPAVLYKKNGSTISDPAKLSRSPNHRNCGVHLQVRRIILIMVQ
jgi:hypothetical protein